MYFLKKYFLHSYKKYIISILIAAVIVFINVKNKGSYTINYANGFFIAGFSFCCIGGLSVLSHFGAYDFFSYAFYRKKANLDYQTYIEQKVTKRKNNNIPYGPYFATGAFFILVSLIISVFFL